MTYTWLTAFEDEDGFIFPVEHCDPYPGVTFLKRYIEEFRSKMSLTGQRVSMEGGYHIETRTIQTTQQ